MSIASRALNFGTKPHILHFLADDFGWANVGFHRAPPDARSVRTPHIDSLVAEGVERDVTTRTRSAHRPAARSKADELQFTSTW